MDWRELLGLIAGALTTTGFIPQVRRLFKLRSAHEISLPFTIFFITGVGFWLLYGVLLGRLSIIIWNAITLALGCAMLYAKLRYGR